MKLQTRLLILFMIYFMIIVKHSNKLYINKHSRELTSGVWTETLKFI